MNFIIEHIFLVGIVVISGGALLWPALSMRGKRASPLEVTQMINRGKSLVLDVRDTAAFANGHLRDAKNIPLTELVGRVGELDKSKSKTVVLVCQKGVRSPLAAKVLAKAGFADVVSLDGGVTAWQAAGLPLAK
ncbi:rhodanese-related sulfurtransferase [Janthinobacterium sp. CG_23.3]|uniref:rhodanese-like domain-containing protein n=1 Tax=unclassified Janthinobacterium TaxID=2610881 RepID=UPI00034BF503|nr:MULTISPECIES: rhodanese-like domain-containing protein [unclassified Janthinobacterium]MEC5158947.1 rhodanese-related sulfurtransferase [Janthinobacterium sp. CG_S6]